MRFFAEEVKAHDPVKAKEPGPPGGGGIAKSWKNKESSKESPKQSLMKDKTGNRGPLNKSRDGANGKDADAGAHKLPENKGAPPKRPPNKHHPTGSVGKIAALQSSLGGGITAGLGPGATMRKKKEEEEERKRKEAEEEEQRMREEEEQKKKEEEEQKKNEEEEKKRKEEEEKKEKEEEEKKRKEEEEKKRKEEEEKKRKEDEEKKKKKKEEERRRKEEEEEEEKRRKADNERDEKEEGEPKKPSRTPPTAPAGVAETKPVKKPRAPTHGKKLKKSHHLAKSSDNESGSKNSPPKKVCDCSSVFLSVRFDVFCVQRGEHRHLPGLPSRR